jgi:hypothetical protein
MPVISTITAAEAKAALKKWRAKARANPKPPPYTEAQWSAAAISYARWLAARDGIEVTPLAAVNAWATVHWSPCNGDDIRPHGVSFDNVTILLPHWNHVPKVTSSEEPTGKRVVLANGIVLFSSWYEQADRTPNGALRNYGAWTARQAKAQKENNELWDRHGPAPVTAPSVETAAAAAF